MSITVTWENTDKTAIYVYFSRPWTLADFDNAEAEIRRLASSTPNTINLMLDLSDASMTPLPPESLDHFVDATHHRLANRGKLIFIGADLFAKTTVRAVEAMADVSDPALLFAPTREQAHLALEKRR